jgi:hypothetical protein
MFLEMSEGLLAWCGLRNLRRRPERPSCRTVAGTGRLRLARCVVDDGWPLRRAAERFQVSVATAKRWADRYRVLGEAGMADCSSRPHTSFRRTPTRTERCIIKVGSCAGGARRESQGCCGGPRYTGSWSATGSIAWTGRVIRRYERATLVSWCTWTSRS